MVVLSCCLGCTCSDRERPVVLSVLPVLVRGLLPCLWVRLVCVWPDALLGLPALGRERMVICGVFSFLWFGSRPRSRRCKMLAVLFLSALGTWCARFVCYLVFVPGALRVSHE